MELLESGTGWLHCIRKADLTCSQVLPVCVLVFACWNSLKVATRLVRGSRCEVSLREGDLKVFSWLTNCISRASGTEKEGIQLDCPTGKNYGFSFFSGQKSHWFDGKTCQI